MAKELNSKQREFAQLVAQGSDPDTAYSRIYAEWTASYAARGARRLLKNKQIQALIDDLKERQLEQAR